jgi:hypothetical protein
MDRLLNERLDTRDDLPILQHALIRKWAVWANDGGRAAIDLDHYERAGSLQDALRLHADEALKGLGEEDRLIAKRMFQTLTETDASNRRIRRPAHLRDVKNLPIEDLKTVKTLYRAKMDKDARQQLQRINKELFTKPCDTWFDMKTPYNVDRKDICE